MVQKLLLTQTYAFLSYRFIVYMHSIYCWKVLEVALSYYLTNREYKQA